VVALIGALVQSLRTGFQVHHQTLVLEQFHHAFRNAQPTPAGYNVPMGRLFFFNKLTLELAKMCLPVFFKDFCYGTVLLLFYFLIGIEKGQVPLLGKEFGAGTLPATHQANEVKVLIGRIKFLGCLAHWVDNFLANTRVRMDNEINE